VIAAAGALFVANGATATVVAGEAGEVGVVR